MLHEQGVGKQEFNKRLVALKQRSPRFGAHDQSAHGKPVTEWLVKTRTLKWVGGTDQDAWAMWEQRLHGPLLAIQPTLTSMPENRACSRLA